MSDSSHKYVQDNEDCDVHSIGTSLLRCPRDIFELLGGLSLSQTRHLVQQGQDLHLLFPKPHREYFDCDLRTGPHATMEWEHPTADQLGDT